jgi:hypothetical protein
VRHTQRKHFDTTRERDKIKDFSTFIWLSRFKSRIIF